MKILLGLLLSFSAFATDATLVKTTGGPIVGTVRGKTISYRGIPYAAAPKGALRWQAPAPPAAWREVRDADRFGPICPQLSLNGAVAGDEDCLSLNVWRPTSGKAGMPVMVFIHGGGNS